MNREDKGSIIDFGDISDADLYVKDCKTSITESELNVSNISWASMVEEELGNSITDKVLTGSIIKEDDEKKTCKKTDIDDIIKTDLKKLNDLEILEYQTFVSGNLRKTIRHHIDNNNYKLDINCLVDKLTWLRMASEVLSKKLGMRPHKHDYGKHAKLFPRSSYKFCNYNYECEFNYNTEKYKGCFAQHYVHNVVFADLNALIKCIECIQEKKTPINMELLKELKKSINTISFVVNHMFDELKSISVISKHKNMKDVHIERTPKKKRNIKKKSKRNKIQTY